MKYDDLASLLKQHGASLTKPRKVVFAALFEQEPLTIGQLISRVGCKVDRATIYRTVELFEKLGIVHRLNIGFKYKLELSDIFRGHHHHFYCTKCGTTFELANNPMLETMIDSTLAKDGFSPRGHQLEVYGLCKECRT